MFSVSSNTNATLFTTSYATGGFQPQITLYTGTGNYIASEAITCPLATVDPTTNLAGDAFLFDASVTPGNYIAVPTDFLN
jgi:hypothetical protein